MKAWYADRPVWQRANEKGHAQLYVDFCFYIDTKEFWVPKIYVCDGASIPRPLWTLIGSPFDPINIEAAWAHDPIYLGHMLSRDVGDEVAFQLWRQSGNGIWAARERWLGVRTGGALAWKNNEKDKKDLAETISMINARPDREKFKSLWPMAA